MRIEAESGLRERQIFGAGDRKSEKYVDGVNEFPAAGLEGGSATEREWHRS